MSSTSKHGQQICKQDWWHGLTKLWTSGN